MSRLCCVLVTLLALAPGLCRAATAEESKLEAERAATLKLFKEKVSPFVTKYCKDCHGDKKRKAGVTFTPALRSPESVDFSRQWQQALAAVKTEAMPPDDTDKQPTDAERKAFADAMAKLKYLYPKDPGPFVMHRLSKVEYGNTLHDLLGVSPDIVHALPDDVGGDGYLNSISPLQLEQYLAIANEALEKAHIAIEAPGTDARASARDFARSFARKAYRRPPTDAEVDVLLKVYDLGTANKLAYADAARLMVKAVLVSPQFLFITPAAPAVSGKDIVPLDDFQLASRLSYLLWSTMPDAELMGLAERGKLHDPAVLRAQTKRLLEDPRSRALFDGFGAQWLGLGALRDKTFDLQKFPQMTAEMREAMYDEARLVFQSIVRENRSVVSFIDCDYTYLNGTLAAIYGMEKSVSGSEMRRVQLTDRNRGGILAMPGILAVTSMPNRTSGVKRGVWVLEQVLGEHVPPPPPNVPTLEKQNQKKVAQLTLRQRTELHRADPVCANCHKLLDPLGFGLENFDAIGRWRTTDDSGGPIDAAGELPGGKRFTTPRELKAIVAERSADVARNVTQKLLAYALGRQLEGYDEIVVDQLMTQIAKDGNRMQSIITQVVSSYPFTHRRVVEHVAAAPKRK